MSTYHPINSSTKQPPFHTSKLQLENPELVSGVEVNQLINLSSNQLLNQSTTPHPRNKGKSITRYYAIQSTYHKTITLIINTIIFIKLTHY